MRKEGRKNMNFKIRCLVGCWVISLLMVVGLAATVDLRLVKAAKNQDREAVSSLLKENVDVNAAQPDGATALAWAVYRDDLETAELLIGAGADLNAVNDYGVTPLSLACDNRNAAMIKKLLRAGADPNAALGTGETPLMTAARTGNMEVVELLLAHGADVNAKEPRQGQTALMWAISFGHPDLAAVLIEHGADVRASTKRLDVEGFTPVVVQGFYAPVEMTPKGGYTPLLFATRVGDLASVRLLLAQGVDVNEASQEEGSPLVIASAAGYEELALFLLEKGADPNVTDANGISPLHYALRDGLKALHGMDISFRTDPAETLVLTRTQDDYAKRSDSILPGHNMPELTKVLLEHGADPNAQLEISPPRLRLLRRNIVNLTGATPFFLASAAADLGSMRMLVEAGAEPLMWTDLNEKEFLKEGYSDANQIQGNATPLMVAVGMGWFGCRRCRAHDFTAAAEERAIEAAKILLNMGADVNEANATGWTPLHAAGFAGANKLVQFLVENGAKVDVQNGCGQTPLSLAMGRDFRGLLDPFDPHEDTAELLRKLGAGTTPLSGPVGRCVKGRFNLEFTRQKA
jgi:ankyrin repeat protein